MPMTLLIELREDADGERDARAVARRGSRCRGPARRCRTRNPAGRLFGDHQVGIHHRIGVREPRREHADHDREHEQRAADGEIGAELHRVAPRDRRT